MTSPTTASPTTTTGYSISGLDPAPFAPLFALSDAELAARQIRRTIVEDPMNGYPCRISLSFAGKGDEVLLLSHQHQASETSPYRASGPIFVRRGAAPFRHANRLPDVLARRLMSIRAYDADDMLIDAEVAEGLALAMLIESWTQRADVAYLHAHFARQGCFACRIDKAQP